MAVVGIDPGKDGGIAFIFSDIVMAIPMPVIVEGKCTDIDFHAGVLTVKALGSREKITAVCCERAGARPGQGVTSMFTFGKLFGQIRALFEAMGYPVLIVTPQKWKKRILPNTLKDKAAAIAYVKEHYPETSLLKTSRCRVPHDGMADAVCIAEYMRLLEADEE